KIEGNARRQGHFSRQPTIGVDRLIDEASRVGDSAPARRGPLPPARLRACQYGNDFERALGRDPFQTTDVSGLRHEPRSGLLRARLGDAGFTPPERGPRIFFMQAADVPQSVNAPESALPRLVAKRLERNRHFDRITVRSQHPLRFHHYIDAEIRLAPFAE